MGTPDLYVGKSIMQAKHIIDIKSSYDIFTFFRNISKGVIDQYYWQMQCYMALSGAQSSTLAFVLTDTPEVILNDEKRRLMWKMGVATEENTDFQQACAEIDTLLTYSDIPLTDRVLEFEVKRDNADIQRLYDRVKKARQFLNELELSLHPPMIAQFDNEVKATMVWK